jgi:hypothetical protein
VYSTNEVSFAPNVYLPQVETVSAKPINDTSAYLIGNIVDAGDPEYTERGFLYATIQYPTLEDAGVTKVVVTKTSSTQFEKQVSIIGLSQTIYYVRAYAKSSEGVSYGAMAKLATSEYLDYTQLPTFRHENSTYRVAPEFDVERIDWYQATSLCENLVYGGYSDWLVPTKAELITMYVNRAEIGGFMDEYVSIATTYGHSYWSSTSDSSDRYAWLLYWSSGNPYEHDKDNSSDCSFYSKCYLYRVRCVRKEN